jgi:putative hydrolase of the HAD superfamily
LSDLAEYARRLHKTSRRLYERALTPCGRYAGSREKLRGVRAVIFDVYGTMINYWRPGFEDKEVRESMLAQAFAEVADRFGMGATLRKINPQDAPARTLGDFYNGLLSLNRRKSVNAGAELPEVRVEDVWSVILMILARNGYDIRARIPGDVSASASMSTSASKSISTPTSTSTQTSTKDFARYLAYTYNFFSMGRELYPGVASALKRLKDGNIVLGILSDAQLYTPIDLTLLLRDQSGGRIDDWNELFDVDLTFLSCEYGFVKPSEVLFRRLFDALYEYQITPAQTVFAGNDIAADIEPAAALGMRTALFCGDDIMALGGGAGAVPDVVFKEWGDLPELISFHGEAE